MKKTSDMLNAISPATKIGGWFRNSANIGSFLKNVVPDCVDRENVVTGAFVPCPRHTRESAWEPWGMAIAAQEKMVLGRPM